MKNNLSNDAFQYTYSAKEQEEVKRIREKYFRREEDKMERLRRLDRGVTQKAQTASLILGVLGTLLLGFGMSLFMTDLSAQIGSNKELAMILGIVIGLLGGVLISLAYPIYHFVIKRERKKIAPEILRLTDELMK